MPLLRSTLLAAFAGIFLGLSAAPHEVPFGPVLFAPLFGVALGLAPSLDTVKQGVRHGLLVGLAAGAACNALVLYWVVGLMQDFARFPWIAALLVGVLLWAGQAGPMMFAGAVAGGLRARGVPLAVGVPVALTVGFAFVWQLFPWHPAVGMLPFLPWVQAADLAGQSLLDALLFAGGTLLCAVFDTPLGRAPRTRRARMGMVLGAALCLGLPAVYGAIRLPEVRAARAAAPTVQVGVVQPNVGIFEKHDRRYFRMQIDVLRRQTREVEAAGAEVVIWPETAYPYGFARGASTDRNGPFAVLRDGVRGPVLVGTATYGDGCETWNSVLALQADGRVTGQSDKVELLYFGERVPLWEVLPPLQWAFECPGVYPGEAPGVLNLGGADIGVLNCYEDVLDHYGRAVVQEHPDYLVNVTNDAWFGDSSEPVLHHMVARMRSIETRRDLVRAVNTGVSGHIAATGENLVLTETFVPATFVTTVAKLGAAEGTIGRTVYVRIGRAFEWLCLALLLGLVVWARRSRPEPNKGVSESPQTGSSDSGRATEEAVAKGV
ncbi:MAG: apolipoprotein N-acyltransferase [Polyangiales bacterium]|nr:apolipoprotein N-acyltransferase [Sandaracinaceae bacterium]